MKKIAMVGLTIILFLISVFPLTGCDFFDGLFAVSDDKDADNKLESFVECLNKEDRVGIKSLFAKSKIADLTNFDESIEELFQYYNGKFVSIS